MSFLPIFALEAQEGRLFKPLAYTKTFAMAAAALLSVTLVPALMMLFVRGRIMPGAQEPAEPVADLALPAGDPPGAALQGAPPSCSRSSILAGGALAGDAARHRVHAEPQRGHAVLHADHAAGPVGHQGGGAAADAGQDHQVVPGGGIGLGQGRPRRDRHRSRRRPRCSRPSST